MRHHTVLSSYCPLQMEMPINLVPELLMLRYERISHVGLCPDIFVCNPHSMSWLTCSVCQFKLMKIWAVWRQIDLLVKSPEHALGPTGRSSHNILQGGSTQVLFYSCLSHITLTKWTDRYIRGHNEKSFPFLSESWINLHVYRAKFIFWWIVRPVSILPVSLRNIPMLSERGQNSVHPTWYLIWQKSIPTFHTWICASHAVCQLFGYSHSDLWEILLVFPNRWQSHIQNFDPSSKAKLTREKARIRLPLNTAIYQRLPGWEIWSNLFCFPSQMYTLPMQRVRLKTFKPFRKYMSKRYGLELPSPLDQLQFCFKGWSEALKQLVYRWFWAEPPWRRM